MRFFGELLWDTQRDTWSTGRLWGARVRAAGCAGPTDELLPGYLAGSTGKLLWDQRDTWRIDWQAPLVGYSAGSTDKLLWWGIRRDPLVRFSGRATLAGYSAGIHYSGILSGILGGPTGGLYLVLGGIHWPVDPAECPTRAARQWIPPSVPPELLASECPAERLASGSRQVSRQSGLPAALAGYWVGAWCRSIANADSSIKSNSPFLSR